MPTQALLPKVAIFFYPEWDARFTFFTDQQEVLDQALELYPE